MPKNQGERSNGSNRRAPTDKRTDTHTHTHTHTDATKRIIAPAMLSIMRSSIPAGHQSSESAARRPSCTSTSSCQWSVELHRPLTRSADSQCRFSPARGHVAASREIRLGFLNIEHNNNTVY